MKEEEKDIGFEESSENFVVISSLLRVIEGDWDVYIPGQKNRVITFPPILA